MLRTIRRISAIAYGLGIVGALTVGAGQVLGRAVYSDCIYRPPTFQGACIAGPGALEDCRARCGPNYEPTCTPGGCCECLSH